MKIPLSIKLRLAKILQGKPLDLLLKFNGISIKEAKTDEELELVYRIRYKIYLGEGYIQSNDRQMFQDKYDPYSKNLLVFKRSNVIGTARLILNSPVGLWTEALFNFEPLNVAKDKLAEISRLAILKENRGKGGLIMLGLMKKIYTLTRKIGIDYIYINCPQKLANYIKSYNVPLIEPKEKSPTPENLKSRELIKGYFQQRTLKPFIINVSEGKKIFSS